jgi:hypothetical protein
MAAMNWSTGNWTSYPENGCVILERSEDGWWIYPTDIDGYVLSIVQNGKRIFTAPLNEKPYLNLEDAQQWVVSNLTST